MTFERQVIAYKNYFLDFYEKQPDNVQAKIEWTLNLIRVTRQGSNIYRIFSFFDKGNLVVLGNAFLKKTQKTPKQELEKALKIMEEYQDENKE